MVTFKTKRKKICFVVKPLFIKNVLCLLCQISKEKKRINNLNIQIKYRSEEFQPRQAKKREYEPIIEENEENEQSPRIMNNGMGNLRERDLRQVNIYSQKKTNFS